MKKVLENDLRLRGPTVISGGAIKEVKSFVLKKFIKSVKFLIINFVSNFLFLTIFFFFKACLI